MDKTGWYARDNYRKWTFPNTAVQITGSFFFNGNDKGSGLYLKLGNFCRPLFMQFLKYILVLSRGEGPRPSFFAGTGA